ncbi:hypothetical protein [Streptomyces gibsoniae]|uniref:Uncharacterized protein n=1 Tax=Streptomyces gibsoniae TaxID=3075529 RepID=A0ABU2U7W3_9ACTN|nr:hypothetical protein [Streptomyces sp. DSM 41699]MDT0469324.1 hypothetical protein [Streptomyces sp. DSM 41699]
MDGWDRVGRIAGYAAALALTPYVFIKASWVVGSLVGALPVGAGFTTAGWVLLNTVTIGMAAAGIAVALTLVRPWGRRVPGRPLAFCAWVAVGFLVPLLPYAVLGWLFGPADGQVEARRGDDPVMPGWEPALVQIGFVGMGLGLALALPAYLRSRWPEVFAGRLDSGSRRQILLLRGAVLACGVVGLAWLSWSAGFTVAVEHPAARDLNWRLLTGLSGAWALIAGMAACMLQREGPTRLPHWIPASAAWIGSGSLFAWSGWKLAFTLYLMAARPAGASLPEDLAVAACLHAAAFVAGATLARALARGAVRGRHAGSNTPRLDTQLRAPRERLRFGRRGGGE